MSERIYNRPKHGVGPEDIYALSNVRYEPSEMSDNNFYNLTTRDKIDPDKIKTLTDYQNFVNCDWKKPHGTYDAVKRFGDKLIGKYEEDKKTGKLVLVDPGECHELAQAYDSPESETRTHDIISELGDVAFLAVALMSNSSSDLDIAMKRRLLIYTASVIAFDDHGQTGPPSWYDEARDLATKFHPITISEVDQLMENDFEPLLGRPRNIWPDEGPDASLEQHLDTIKLYSDNLVSGARQQYRYGGDDENLARFKNHDLYIDHIGELAADIVLEIAYFAKTALQKSLTDVVHENVRKLTGRVGLGLVDKEDGDRPKSLQ